MDLTRYIKSIRHASYTGLIVSVALALAAIIFIVFCKYRFYMNDNGFLYCMIAGCVVAVLDMSTVLLAVRKSYPKLRQNDNLEEKLKGYNSLIKNIYYGTMVAVAILSTLIVLSNNSRLIMLLLLVVLILFFCFPNMYKMKVDLGLDEEQMRMLFGNDYIPDEPVQEDKK